MLDAPRDARPALQKFLPLVEKYGVWIGGALLAAFYAKTYFSLPALPTTATDGWWTWWDQSNYLKSANALWRGWFFPDMHNYPLAYSALAAPFTAIWPVQPFFLIDLTALLAVYFAFLAFTKRIDIGAGWAIVLFFGSVAADPVLFEQWVTPWSTTPVAALIWLQLAVVAAHLARTEHAKKHYFILGLLTAAVPFFRPVDVAMSVLAIAAVAASDIAARRFSMKNILPFTAGAAVIVLPYVEMHLLIYGLHNSFYMGYSKRIGFVFWNFPWKIYMIFVNPYDWFTEGRGILQHSPWIALTVPGLLLACMPQSLVAARARPALWLLIAMLVVYLCIYTAYVDLVPNGLWRYNNINYFKWTYPAFALVGFLFLRRLFSRNPALPLAALALAGLLLCIHLYPVQVERGKQANMVDTSTPCSSWQESYASEAVIRDERHDFQNIFDMKVLPLATGERVIAFRRPFRGKLSWVKSCGQTENIPGAVLTYWNSKIGWGWPAWLPPYPPAHNPLFP